MTHLSDGTLVFLHCCYVDSGSPVPVDLQIELNNRGLT